MFHITNGDSVISSFRQARFPGSYLAWRDVLHDGPVPQTETLNELSMIRAAALADFGAGDAEKMRQSFAERDRMLEGFRKYPEVVLWFEHDLYDQLQLIQLLDWFSEQELGGTRVSLIQINEFPGITPFYGLGQLSGRQLVQLFPSRRTVSTSQFNIAREAWKAFRSSSPEALLEFAQRDHAGMPFLRTALTRFLQEYPWQGDGLSRSERQILRALETGARTKPEIYKEWRKLESDPWGDSSVYLRLEQLASGAKPAVQKSGDQYELTDHGRALLAGNADRVSDAIDLWLGGVHLTGDKVEWRWSEAENAVKGTA
jgi:uncharacterized protein DUF1835